MCVFQRFQIMSIKVLIIGLYRPSNGNMDTNYYFTLSASLTLKTLGKQPLSVLLRISLFNAPKFACEPSSIDWALTKFYRTILAGNRRFGVLTAQRAWAIVEAGIWERIPGAGASGDPQLVLRHSEQHLGTGRFPRLRRGHLLSAGVNRQCRRSVLGYLLDIACCYFSSTRVTSSNEIK